MRGCARYPTWLALTESRKISINLNGQPVVNRVGDLWCDLESSWAFVVYLPALEGNMPRFECVSVEEAKVEVLFWEDLG